MINDRSPGIVIVMSLELSLMSLKINRYSTKIHLCNFSTICKRGDKK